MQVYGPSAWWWEVEELLRKLLLSAVVVLIESGSPLQVCLLRPLTTVSASSTLCRFCCASTAKLPTCVTGSTGDAGSVGQWLGARLARDIQALGPGFSAVPSPTRLPLRHVVRVPHGTSTHSSESQGMWSQTVAHPGLDVACARESRVVWYLVCTFIACLCGFLGWVPLAALDVTGFAVQSEWRQLYVCDVRHTGRCHVRAMRDVCAVLALRRREELGGKLERSQSEPTARPCAGAVVSGEQAGRGQPLSKCNLLAQTSRR